MKLQNSLPNSIGLGRRQFMALSAGTAMAGLFGRSVPASADTKAASLPVAQTGHGEWTYRTNPHWGELPAGTAFGGTHAAIATDKAGALYVSTQSSTGILVYDSDGKLQRRIASEYPEVHSMLHTEEEGKEYLYVTCKKCTASEDWLFLKLLTDGTVARKITAPPEAGFHAPDEWKITAAVPGPDG